jgi:hypothetical protein
VTAVFTQNRAESQSGAEALVKEVRLSEGEENPVDPNKPCPKQNRLQCQRKLATLLEACMP